VRSQTGSLEDRETGTSRAGQRRERCAGGVVARRSHAGSRSPVSRSPGYPVYLLVRDRHRNWGFPKGHVEQGETDEGAARREVHEETGLDGLALRGDAGTINWTFRSRGRVVHKVCRYFVFEATDGATRPRRSEGITACRWLPLRDALAKLTFDNARGVLASADALLGAESRRP